MARKSFLVAVVNASIQAAKQAERERAKQQAAQDRYQDQMAKEAKRAWVDDMIDEAESQTEELHDLLEEIDSILQFTLDVDDYYDLERIRQQASHPVFESRNDLPISEPNYLPLPPKPSAQRSVGSRFVSKFLIGNVKHKHLEKKENALKQVESTWEKECLAIVAQNVALKSAWKDAEQARQKALKFDKDRYKQASLAREIEVQKANTELDELILGLSIGQKVAVETYAELVFAESEYPEGLEPQVNLSFNEITRELDLQITAPGPEAMPQHASFSFQRNIGKIVSKPQTKRDLKERYETYVCALALRSMHEIFEADRNNVINVVAISVSVKHISQATGNLARTRILEAATDRNTFDALNLKSVVPRAAFEALGGALSKNIFGLVELPMGKSVSKS